MPPADLSRSLLATRCTRAADQPDHSGFPLSPSIAFASVFGFHDPELAPLPGADGQLPLTYRLDGAPNAGEDPVTELIHALDAIPVVARAFVVQPAG